MIISQLSSGYKTVEVYFNAPNLMKAVKMTLKEVHVSSAEKSCKITKRVFFSCCCLFCFLFVFYTKNSIKMYNILERFYIVITGNNCNYSASAVMIS